MTTWLDDFEEAINTLDKNLAEFLASGGDVDEVLSVLVRMHDLKSQVAIVYGTAEHGASSVMLPGREYSVGGKILEQKTGSSRKKWQHEALARTVVERILQRSINEETGEVEITAGQMAEKLLEYAHTDYWRGPKLHEELGINIDMYSEVGDSKTSVSVRKGK